ncbi:50S ribosomal protein L6 [bacterium]|nr:50S ribosomal protein L6 [bacterium]
MVKTKESLAKVWNTYEISVPLEDGIEAKYEDSILSLKNSKGEVSKKLKYPHVYIEVKEKEVLVGTKHYSKREFKIIHTFRAHIKNLVRGLSEGFEYKLAIVYAKFPMTVSVSGNKFEVKNLLGEKVPRTYMISSGVKVVVNGKEILVSGIDKEKTGQVAASIEQLTRITHLDRRVIQDGIFITEKPHKRYV